MDPTVNPPRAKSIDILTPIWIVASIVAFCTISAPKGGIESFARLVLAVPMVLYFPGRMLTSAFLPSSGGDAQVGLAVPLSFAVSILVGLVLNAIGRLTPEGWVIALGSLCLLLWISSLRRASRDTEPLPIRTNDPRRLFASAGLLCLAMAISVAAVSLARQGAEAHQQFKFTEFWMVPKDAAARDVVTVGVRNDEGADSDYSVDLTLDGAIIAQFPTFRLGSGTSKAFDFVLPQNVIGQTHVEARLYRNRDRSTIYRKVWLATSGHASSQLQTPLDIKLATLRRGQGS